ncbi:MAG: iron-containing alcohol dehydrogenase, partial [Candidatus Altarchaeaceae archaeon]
MKKIELPRKVIVGEDAIYEIKNVVNELNLDNPLIVCGKITKKFAEIVYEQINGEIFIVDKDSDLNFDFKNKHKFVCGVGGGNNIDIGKIFAYKNKIPFISIPTAASHDVISSPQVSSNFIKNGKFYTSFLKSPIA